MNTIHINGADVHPALLVINIIISVGYIIQWVIFATIVSRSITLITLSRQQSIYNFSSNDCDSTGGGQPSSSKKKTGASRSRSMPLTERQRIARTKLTMIFFQMVFASIYGIDATAIYTDAWVVVRYFAFNAFGLFASFFWTFYIYQHIAAFYVAMFGDLRGPPKWTKYVALAIFVALQTPPVVLSIIFFVGGRLIFETWAMILHSLYLVVLASSLAIFVYTILRHMEQHRKKRRNPDSVGEEDIKEKRGIQRIRRFGYGTVALFFLIAVFTVAGNVPNLLGPADRLLEQQSQFGPRENRDPTDFAEIQPTFFMFVVLLFIHRTQWIPKADIQPSEMSSTLQTIPSSLLSIPPTNRTPTISAEPQSEPRKSGQNDSGLHPGAEQAV